MVKPTFNLARIMNSIVRCGPRQARQVRLRIFQVQKIYMSVVLARIKFDWLSPYNFCIKTNLAFARDCPAYPADPFVLMKTSKKESMPTTERKFPTIREEGLDQLRKRIGVRIEETVEPWCFEA